MPLLTNIRGNPTYVEYTVMRNEHTINDSGSRSEFTIINEDVETGRPSVDVSNEETNTPESKTISAKICSQYKGPKINGWPTAPRKLRGFAIPLFVVDVLLILFPIAFLSISIKSQQLKVFC